MFYLLIDTDKRVGPVYHLFDDINMALNEALGCVEGYKDIFGDDIIGNVRDCSAFHQARRGSWSVRVIKLEIGR